MEKQKSGRNGEARVRQDSPARLLKSIQKRLDELSELGPEIIGSLCSRSGKCGRPGCACAKGARLHLSWQLTSTERGRTRTVYVPLAALEQVRQWADNHKRGRKLRGEVSELCERYIRTVVPRERALKRRVEATASPAAEEEGQ